MNINIIKNAISAAAAFVLVFIVFIMSASANYTAQYKFSHYDSDIGETRYYFSGDKETVIEKITVSDNGDVKAYIGTMYGTALAVLVDDDCWYFNYTSGEFNSIRSRFNLAEEFNYLMTAIN